MGDWRERLVKLVEQGELARFSGEVRDKYERNLTKMVTDIEAAIADAARKAREEAAMRADELADVYSKAVDTALQKTGTRDQYSSGAVSAGRQLARAFRGLP